MIDLGSILTEISTFKVKKMVVKIIEGRLKTAYQFSSKTMPLKVAQIWRIAASLISDDDKEANLDKEERKITLFCPMRPGLFQN